MDLKIHRSNEKHAFCGSENRKQNPDPDYNFRFFRGFLNLRDFVNSAIFAIFVAFTRFSSLPQFSSFSGC